MVETEHKCKQCGIVKPIETGFYKDAYQRSGFYYTCRDCKSQRSRKYLQTDVGRKNAIVKSRKWKKINPHKHEARLKLRVAVKAGKISKLTNCEVCGGTKPLQGHHYDYSKPFDVYWLCTDCHHAVHRKYNKLVLNPKLDKRSPSDATGR